MSSDLMRVLSFERNAGACDHYRVVQPLYKLLINNFANILTIHKENCLDLDFVTQKMNESDIILVYRPADIKWFNLIKAAQEAGKFVVADYDDDPFNTSPWNPSYRYYGVSEYSYDIDGEERPLWENGVDGFFIENNIQRRDMFRASFKKADLVTCTTDILKDKFNKINPNTVVLPNLVDFDLFKPIEMKKKEIRIGYVFGASHYEDFYLVKDVLKRIVKKHDNVKLVFFGDSSFHGLFSDIDENRIEWHPWISFAAYPYKLVTLNFDIGICPLADNEFNRCKSSLKWMEYSAIKVPTLASDIPPYSKTITNGKDGILVKENEWEDAIENIISDSKLRKRLANNAYDNVRENHNADTSAYLWRDAYDQLLKKDILEIIK